MAAIISSQTQLWNKWRQDNLDVEIDLGHANLVDANLGGTKLNDTTQIDAKWLLVWDILNNPTSNRDLKGANLVGANLGRADLRWANLEGMVRKPRKHEPYD
ncbi:pentapeptide repeat-containing protein [Gloeocapsa sp. PCC 73106]|uniref:pentapeptide repeat-containing protein n=1 Tax=Gloeocapsa sp. PCC 73106 TaxID=102232 RepID=UPI0002F55986|nr:pentapeptide repeat-containing protein [Gloeocapsa sp. PCC 73106]